MKPGSRFLGEIRMPALAGPCLAGTHLGLDNRGWSGFVGADPCLAGFEDRFAGHVVDDDGGHHVPSGECGEDEHVGGDRIEDRKSEVAEIEQQEADDQRCKGDGHGGMDKPGGDPEDECEQRPCDEEHADVFATGFVNTGAVEEPDDGEADPERAVAAEGGKAEIVTHFLFHEAGDELGGAAECEAHGEHRSDAAEAEIVELQQEGGEAETGESDDRGVSKFCVVHGMAC